MGGIIFMLQSNIDKQEVEISSISLPFIIENQSSGIPQNQNQKPKIFFVWMEQLFEYQAFSLQSLVNPCP